MSEDSPHLGKFCRSVAGNIYRIGEHELALDGPGTSRKFLGTLTIVRIVSPDSLPASEAGRREVKPGHEFRMLRWYEDSIVTDPAEVIRLAVEYAAAIKDTDHD